MTSKQGVSIRGLWIGQKSEQVLQSNSVGMRICHQMAIQRWKQTWPTSKWIQTTKFCNKILQVVQGTVSKFPWKFCTFHIQSSYVTFSIQQCVPFFSRIWYLIMVDLCISILVRSIFGIYSLGLFRVGSSRFKYSFGSFIFGKTLQCGILQLSTKIKMVCLLWHGMWYGERNTLVEWSWYVIKY